MTSLALSFAISCFGLALLMNLWRVVFSPTLGDRVLALDTMTINMIALAILFGVVTRTTIYFEVSLVIALVGFVSTVAYTRYALRGNIIE